MIVVLENFVFGFDGVVVFMIEIVELDKDGGVLCYCGVDIEDLVSQWVIFGDVWVLLVDGNFGSGLLLVELFLLLIYFGDVCVDVQVGLVMLVFIWGYVLLFDIDDVIVC